MKAVNFGDTWVAEVMRQLRNPPTDTLLWPIIFWIAGVGLIASALVPFAFGRTDIVWPQWHIDLILFALPRLAAVNAVWAIIIALTWFADQLRGVPTITSNTPTYHRAYYVIKHGMLAFSGLIVFLAVMVAVILYWEQSVPLTIITVGMLGMAALLYFRNWTPRSMWHVSGWQTNLSGISQIGGVALGLAYLMLGVFSVLGAILGSQNIIWVIIRLGFMALYLLVGYYGCRAFIAHTLFALTHLGIIRK